MAEINRQMTLNAFRAMAQRQGGDLRLENDQLVDVYFEKWFKAVRVPAEYKPFKISIYDFDRNVDVVSLYLLVNPSDINIGQVHISSNAYTRVGWITTIWGRQQETIASNGLSAGFFYVNGRNYGGITNFYRKQSEAFTNLMSLVSIFKNNGAYFLKGQDNQTIYGDGLSRVINVLDSVKIEYDETIYYGSFTTFTVTDNAENPHRLEYNFEFVISSFGHDAIQPDGHTKKAGNEVDGDVQIAVQGNTTSFDQTINFNIKELEKYWPLEDKPHVDDSNSNLRGSALDNNEGRIYRSNQGEFPTQFLPRLLEENEELRAALQITSGEIGLTSDQLASIIHFESAGTWSPFVNNPHGSAIGLGQWINDAAVEMAEELERRGIIADADEITTSRDLVARFPTREQQVALYDIYATVTRVPGGKTLKEAINEARTSDEAFNTYMIGHFWPDFVGKSLDEPFPYNPVQKNNPGIRTPRDYIRRVRNIMNNSLKKDNTIKTTQSTGDTR